MTQQPDLEKLKKTRKFCFIATALVAFSGAMKLAGLFAVGFFPVWSEGVLCVALTVYAVVLGKQIDKLA